MALEPSDSSQERHAFSDFNRLNSMLRDLDERALVLTLAAFAEDTLGALLLAFMIPNEASSRLVEGFDAPLGTFSSRIRACYALGLIHKGHYDDLEHLRKVRNRFSHTWEPISFADPSITGHIKALRYSRLEERYPDTLHRKLMTSLQGVLIELHISIIGMPSGNMAKPKYPNLITNFPGETFEAQLSYAADEVAKVVREHAASEADEKVFFDGRLWVLMSRLGKFIAGVPIEGQYAVHELIRQVEAQLDGRPNPNKLM
ncbi:MULTISPECIES: MltR family transcriptional regulator [unclassified Pseudomonas]|uniref:MltR family transcriptional regulator n=1 Tax=unclassified Pseudomonas TaxID=196821 RepID=UPI0025F1A05F|nr:MULTISPECIES: MltR family transcriptional regulator [unclassified Pseudomonas]